jgi:hypothetical protein
MIKTMMNGEKRKNMTINNEDGIDNPRWGEKQRHSGAYPASMNYMTKEGRRLAPLPRRLLWQGHPFTLPQAGGRCGGHR